MQRLWSWVVGLFILAVPAQAEDSPVVIELYTSQGCSSCPPADALLHELAEQDGVVALAMHVDYWDYIGWKDSFADPEHTNRQRSYSRAAGSRMIYTPQMVINGQDHVIGNRPRDVINAINQHRQTEPNVALSAQRKGDTVEIEAVRNDGATAPLIVQLVRYRPESTVDIKRGENAGRTLSYANVVTELTVISTWKGNEPLSVTAPVKGEDPVVVLIQGQEGSGAVEAVALLK